MVKFEKVHLWILPELFVQKCNILISIADYAGLLLLRSFYYILKQNERMITTI